MNRLLLAFGLCVLELNFARGHGRLWDPPARGTMWRRGFNTPVNYDDNQLYCGGFDVQWKQNDGKCGVCGDSWSGPRDHEPEGIFYTGTIAGNYTSGQEISVNVEITATCHGWFEFRLCENNELDARLDQFCLDEHLLPLKYENGQSTGTRRPVTNDPAGHFITLVTLPAEVTCSHCLLQWKWHCGDKFGKNDDDKYCLGCGPQEEFYGCANIAITDAEELGQTTEPPSTSTPGPASTPGPTTTRCYGVSQLSIVEDLDSFCTTICLEMKFCPSTLCKCEGN